MNQPGWGFCDEEEKAEWLEGYRNFIGGYQEIFEGYKNASAERKRPAVEWPAGSYPPSCRHPVWFEDAA